jgi:hypothetical protein
MNEDKEETGWEVIGEDKAIADKYRQEKMFASFTFSSKHIKKITDLINIHSTSIVDENTKRLKERVGRVEQSVANLDKSMALKDKDHDHKIELLEQRLNEKISTVKVIGALATLLLAAISSYAALRG